MESLLLVGRISLDARPPPIARWPEITQPSVRLPSWIDQELIVIISQPTSQPASRTVNWSNSNRRIFHPDELNWRMRWRRRRIGFDYLMPFPELRRCVDLTCVAIKTICLVRVEGDRGKECQGKGRAGRGLESIGITFCSLNDWLSFHARNFVIKLDEMFCMQEELWWRRHGWMDGGQGELIGRNSEPEFDQQEPIRGSSWRVVNHSAWNFLLWRPEK